MKNEENRYSLKKLKELSISKLQENGLSLEQSVILINSMLNADMNGISTHGIRMLPGYISRINSGQFTLENPIILKQTSAFSLLDAKNGIGAVSATAAVNIALEKSQESGIHMVLAKNCNTYGPAFHYIEKLSEEGLIGFTCCNSPAAMPAYYGLEQMLGTNPFAFSCPSASQGTIVVDMATSVVAKSKFETARLNGDKLEEGWALDSEGNPTTDPVKAIQGFVLPMAGFKGYGIAMIIDILSGVLSGASYLNKVGKFYSKDNKGMNVGQLFIAIDPRIIYDGDFYLEMDKYINTLRNSKRYSDKCIVIPGDNRKNKKRISEEKGVLLSNDTVIKLSELFGVELQCIN